MSFNVILLSLCVVDYACRLIYVAVQLCFQIAICKNYVALSVLFVLFLLNIPGEFPNVKIYVVHYGWCYHSCELSCCPIQKLCCLVTICDEFFQPDFKQKVYTLQICTMKTPKVSARDICYICVKMLPLFLVFFPGTGNRTYISEQENVNE